MYILELLVKAFQPKKKSLPSYNPDAPAEDIIENADECNHFFMPLDSSNTMFACKYCGLVVPREKLKNKNIFEKH